MVIYFSLFQYPVKLKYLFVSYSVINLIISNLNKGLSFQLYRIKRGGGMGGTGACAVNPFKMAESSRHSRPQSP